MDEQLENRLRFLRKVSAEQMPYSDVGLFDHLLGTRRLLVEWKARPALCDAGLFHSVYSTEYYELKAILPAHGMALAAHWRIAQGLTFIKNDRGEVTAVIFHRGQGLPDSEGKKLKNK